MPKYAVTGYQKLALSALMPPPSLTVAECAEQHRVLDAKSAMPGPWRNHVTPYLIDIMDEYNNPDTEEIIFVKPTQIGGTETLLNALGYILLHDPADAMFVYPTEKLAKRTSENRIQPMLLGSPALRERFFDGHSSRLELQCEGMTIWLTGANSPSDLASTPIRYLFLDEVDKYPTNSQKEADPIRLARERTKTYHNRKICITSTPTFEGGHIWKALQSADIVKHFVVSCPHCGEMIELRFAQIKWPSKEHVSGNADRSRQARYVCQECGCIIADSQKPDMLRNGCWRVVERHTDYASRVAYWINTLYSPFVRWEQIAKEFMDSHDTPELLQNFTNSWLAEPWKEVKRVSDAALVMEKQTEYPEMVVPRWAQLLTAGVDVQENCLYWTIRAWGPGKTSQKICSGRVSAFSDIISIMNTEYRSPDGTAFLVHLCAIDSGDQTDDVYDFCAENSEWAVPVKGSSHPLNLNYYRPSVINKQDSRANGMRLVLVDGDRCKDFIFARLHKEVGDGCWMVHKGCDETYAKQITAEQKISERKNGRMVTRWKPKISHADNHYLDCEVYAFVAAELCHVGDLVDEPSEECSSTATRTKQSAWIDGNASWI